MAQGNQGGAEVSTHASVRRRQEAGTVDIYVTEFQLTPP